MCCLYDTTCILDLTSFSVLHHVLPRETARVFVDITSLHTRTLSGNLLSLLWSQAVVCTLMQAFDLRTLNHYATRSLPQTPMPMRATLSPIHDRHPSRSPPPFPLRPLSFKTPRGILSSLTPHFAPPPIHPTASSSPRSPAPDPGPSSCRPQSRPRCSPRRTTRRPGGGRRRRGGRWRSCWRPT